MLEESLKLRPTLSRKRSAVLIILISGKYTVEIVLKFNDFSYDTLSSQPYRTDNPTLYFKI
jgi:hypothetical protein